MIGGDILVAQSLSLGSPIAALYRRSASKEIISSWNTSGAAYAQMTSNLPRRSLGEASFFQSHPDTAIRVVAAKSCQNDIDFNNNDEQP